MFRNYLGNTQGSFAVNFAVASVLLLGAAAVAVNTVQMHSNKTSLNDAADAAILAAVKTASNEIKKNNRGGQWKKKAEDSGIAAFGANSRGIGDLTDPNLKFDFDVINGTTIEGRLIYDVQGSTFLSGILGRDKIDYSQEVRATTSAMEYARFNFMVDVSASMGIGANKFNQDRLTDETGCAIACHYAESASSSSSLPFARSLGIKLRLDTVKEALATVVSELQLKQVVNNQFEVGIYTFSNSVVEHLAPTSNFNSIETAVDSLELTNSLEQGGSNIQFSLDQLAQEIPRGETGENIAHRKSYVIVLTDGVENSVINFPDGEGVPRQILDRNFRDFSPTYYVNGAERIQGFNPNACDTLKNEDHVVVFINPNYLIPDTPDGHSQDRFDHIEENLISAITTNAKACASSANYGYSAESEQEVMTAIEQLILEIFEDKLRISQ